MSEISHFTHIHFVCSSFLIDLPQSLRVIFVFIVSFLVLTIGPMVPKVGSLGTVLLVLISRKDKQKGQSNGLYEG